MSRFLLLTPGLLDTGGVSMVARQIARALMAAEGAAGSLSIYSLGDAPGTTRPAWLRDGQVRFAGNDRQKFIRWALRLAAARRPPEYVISAHVNVAQSALPLVTRGARHVVFLHSWEVWHRLPLLKSLVVRSAWRLLSNSRYTRDRFLMANPGLAAQPVLPCLLGVSAHEAVRPTERRLVDGKFALIVSRLSSLEGHKGHDLLLELWPQVRLQAPDLSLVIAGDGDDRARLEAKARRLDLDTEAARFTGFVSDRDLAALYRDCTFFAMPGRDEGFGLVYLEAMRFGRPCIGGPGAPEEVIIDGKTGFIVDPSNRATVVEAILRLARDDVLRSRMGQAGRDRVARHFTERAFIDRFLGALDLGR